MYTFDDVDVRRHILKCQHLEKRFVSLWSDLSWRLPGISCRAQNRYVAFYFGKLPNKRVLAYFDFQQYRIKIGVKQGVLDEVAPDVGRVEFPPWGSKLAGMLLEDAKRTADILERAYLAMDSGGAFRLLQNRLERDRKSFELENAEYEGERTRRYVNFYERSTKNRRAAINEHGVSCKICKFNFGSFYGERGADFIEVHHLKPVSELSGKVLVDPKDDLTVVCANCHRMIHRDPNNVLTVEEMKVIIRASE